MLHEQRLFRCVASEVICACNAQAFCFLLSLGSFCIQAYVFRTVVEVSGLVRVIGKPSITTSALARAPCHHSLAKFVQLVSI